MTVLCISIPDDVHILPVAAELGERGHGISIFNPGALPGSATVTLDGTTSSGDATCVLSWANQTLDLSGVKSVWYRKPDRFEISSELHSSEAEWLRSQCEHTIQGIWSTLDAFWVSEPRSIAHASHKILQKKIARLLGFRLPEYIVTNDPDDAREFILSKPGVVVKALAGPTIVREGVPGVIYTHRVSEDDLAVIDAVRFGPTFLEEFVVKKYDVRVTVIGERVFAVAIDSTASAEGRLDFRSVDVFELPHRPIELPVAVHDACVELVRRLDLRFGAIDLLRTPEGEYVFLEINPNGQWYWIELLTELPMASALCDLLETGGGLRRSRPSGNRAGVNREHGETLEIGTHTVPIPPSHREAGESAPDGPARLPSAATNALMKRKGDQVQLQIGDLDDGLPRRT